MQRAHEQLLECVCNAPDIAASETAEIVPTDWTQHSGVLSENKSRRQSSITESKPIRLRKESFVDGMEPSEIGAAYKWQPNLLVQCSIGVTTTWALWERDAQS